MLTSTLVLMMTIPGLALFYGGMVRKKNVLATLMQSFAITCVVTLLWWFIGYSWAFTPGRVLPGWETSRVHERHDHHEGRQQADRVAPGADDSGDRLRHVPVDLCDHHAGADRRRLRRSHEILRHAGVHGGLVAARVLPDRSLGLGAVRLAGAKGVLDYAGGTVVHINAGIAGLASCLVLGKRVGYGKEAMPPHNLT
jgi:Amt family ammonium transporter